mgnify:CR=1 FL=1
MTKLFKVAFLVDDYDVDFYTYDLIKHVSQSELFENPVVITGYQHKVKKSNAALRVILLLKKIGFIKFINLVLFLSLYRFIKKIELRSVLKTRPEYILEKSLTLIDRLKFISIIGIWSKSKKNLSLTNDDVEIIENENIDVIIRCGSGILKGKILDISTFGVLSFHHGDNRVNRGGPFGFWEVFNSNPSSGFIIQKLNNELDGGDVLFRGGIVTAGIWTLNSANLLAKSNIFMKEILDQIATKRKLPEFELPCLHDRPLYKIDNTSSLFIKYIFKVYVPIVIRKIRAGIFGQKFGRWSIGYSKFDGYKSSLWRYQEVKNPPNRFLADPFIFSSKGRTVIFAEDFFFTDNRGRISAIELTNNRENFLGVVLEEDFHLSFPFVFEDNGRIYMVPETHESNQIRLYECEEFPLKWKFKKTLINNVSAADSMLIKQGDTWFMLTNICSAKIDDHQSELHIFYSKKLITSNWKPIAQGNPVLFDSMRARNGGMFTYENRLYRVNQVQSKGYYGRAFEINLVTQIDKCCYKEIHIDRVEPFFKDDIVSTHHFSSNSDYSVVDFLRMVSKQERNK